MPNFHAINLPLVVVELLLLWNLNMKISYFLNLLNLQIAVNAARLMFTYRCCFRMFAFLFLEVWDIGYLHTFHQCRGGNGFVHLYRSLVS